MHHRESSSQSKVSNFNREIAVKENILRLQITMQHSILVTEGDTSQELASERFNHGWLHVFTALDQSVHELC
jgi:hypothetical protein